MPYVMSMVLADGFGRVLFIFESGVQKSVVMPGVIDFGGKRSSANDMRRAILKRLGDNNMLVNFFVA